MPIDIASPSTDLWTPRPEPGERWHPNTMHTHYFGLSHTEAAIGAFIYLRCQPAFGFCQAGVAIFQGLDNVCELDAAFVDYETTLPWPDETGTGYRTANGLEIEFLEPGREVTVRYRSNDGTTWFDLHQLAVMPLLARGHVMAGEETNSEPQLSPGGTEQFMHCTGELVLNGEHYEIDCLTPRDRSYSQVRIERQGAVAVPPLGWTPMWFGDDLAFNQIGWEAPDTEPEWTQCYAMPADRPAHHWGWVYRRGQALALAEVRRNVTARHPWLHGAMRQEIEATDEEGRRYVFEGECLAMTAVPSWPNVHTPVSVYRWRDEQGRESVTTCQEVWFDRFQRAMKGRRPALVA
jgi:hypothetical protein